MRMTHSTQKFELSSMLEQKIGGLLNSQKSGTSQRTSVGTQIDGSYQCFAHDGLHRYQIVVGHALPY